MQALPVSHDFAGMALTRGSPSQGTRRVCGHYGSIRDQLRLSQFQPPTHCSNLATLSVTVGDLRTQSELRAIASKPDQLINHLGDEQMPLSKTILIKLAEASSKDVKLQGQQRRIRRSNQERRRTDE